MTTISLCMITKNDGNVLKNCLESVKNLVDEIIIVDTGSSDNTKNIAKEYTDKIFDFSWDNDFSKARNFSLSKATKDWILVLDSDETVSLKDHQELKDVVSVFSKRNVSGFTFPIRNYTNNTTFSNWTKSENQKYDEEKCADGYFTSTKLRLFKRSTSVTFEKKVHESALKSVQKIGTIAQLPIPIHHFGYLDEDKRQKKQELYEKITKENVNEEDYKTLFETGRELLQNKKYEEAKTFLKKAVTLKSDDYLVWYMLGNCCLLQKNLTEAQTAFEKSSYLNETFSPAHVNLGIVYSKQKEFQKAIASFIIAIDLNPKDSNAYKNLGLCFHQNNEKEKARAAFEKAIELNPLLKEKIKL